MVFKATITTFGLLCLSMSAAAHAASVNLITNGDFSTPASLPGGYAYNTAIIQNYYKTSGAPTSDFAGAGFAFSGGSGIAENGSPFGVAGAVGGRAGFLQGGNTDPDPATISQSFTTSHAGLYDISFGDEARTGMGPNPFTVELTTDTTTSPPVTPLSISSVGYEPFNTTNFAQHSELLNLAAGTTYTLLFVGDNVPGGGVAGPDVTSFVDNVSVTAVPSPSAVWGGVALFGMSGLWMWRQRSRTLA